MQKNGADNNDRGNRGGRYADTRGREEGGHHDPISNNNYTINNNKNYKNYKNKNNSGSSGTATVPADRYTRAASAYAETAAATALV